MAVRYLRYQVPYRIKVKTAIETMTGLDVSEVNIKIAGVNIDN